THPIDTTLTLHDALPIFAEPSDNWPNGSTPFTDEQQTDYGAYLDIPLKKDAQKVGLLVVNTKTGDKEGDDKFVELFSKDINEVRSEEHTSELQSRFDIVC